MTKLSIDTRESKKIIARIDKDGEVFEEISETTSRNPESIVSVIEKLLAKAKLTLQDVEEVAVEEGPGSYTGLKVGASVANALSFALQKKVNGKDLSELVEPRYE